MIDPKVLASMFEPNTLVGCSGSGLVSVVRSANWRTPNVVERWLSPPDHGAIAAPISASTASPASPAIQKTGRP